MIDDYVRERGALAGLDDDVRGVHAVVAELVQDGLARPVVGEFREDGWPQAEPGDRGEAPQFPPPCVSKASVRSFWSGSGKAATDAR